MQRKTVLRKKHPSSPVNITRLFASLRVGAQKRAKPPVSFFPFLKLPPELRLMIYKHAFRFLEFPEWLTTKDDYIRFFKHVGVRPSKVGKLKAICDRLRARQNCVIPMANLGALDLALLRTCRQIYHEAKDVLMKESGCAFFALAIVRKSLFHRPSLPQVSNLSWVFWWPQAYFDGEEQMDENAYDLNFSLTIGFRRREGVPCFRICTLHATSGPGI